MWMSKKVEIYASSYASIEDIPSHLRYENLRDAYESTDLWQEFLADQYFGEGHSDRYTSRLETIGNHWKAFCKEKGEHHGFATPRTVNRWFKYLAEERELTTVYSPYLSTLNRFYHFLMLNINYPHTYNPVKFSIQLFEFSERVWETRHETGGNK